MKNSILQPAIILLLTVWNLSGVTHFVHVDGTNATPPYTNWATAAVSIQDAVDVAVSGDEILVANGVYAAGGRAVGGALTNRVAVDKPLSLRSVNGPEFTLIAGRQLPETTNGDGAIRCVYLANGASLSGFTLTNGATRALGTQASEQQGGGVWCESTNALVTGCVIAGNSAVTGGGAYQGHLADCRLANNYAAGGGGGSAECILNNCTLTNNVAAANGGGAAGCTLNDCVLTDNRAFGGGGAYNCTLTRCRLTRNLATPQPEPWYGYGGGACQSILRSCTLIGNQSGGGGTTFYWGGGAAMSCQLYNCTLAHNNAAFCSGAIYSTLGNCIVYGDQLFESQVSYCWSSEPGVGNITNEPVFVDFAGGNLRLISNSSCINAGDNASVTIAADLDGRPRVVDGAVDMGAYEFQGIGMSEFIGWLEQYGLPTDGSADYTDSDTDGRTAWQEWRCLTDPTNALSVLRLLYASPDGTNVTVCWQSVAGVKYLVERGTSLASLSVFTPLATNVVGQGATTSYTDTNAAAAPHLFYRVSVPP